MDCLGWDEQLRLGLRDDKLRNVPDIGRIAQKLQRRRATLQAPSAALMAAVLCR